MKRWAAYGIALLITPLCSWAQYRCIENGKTVFTGRPCASEAVAKTANSGTSKVIGDQANSAYALGYQPTPMEKTPTQLLPIIFSLIQGGPHKLTIVA